MSTGSDPIQTRVAVDHAITPPSAAEAAQPTTAELDRFARLNDELARFADSITPNALRGRLDPEGVVQEAWLRLQKHGVERIEDRGPGHMGRYLRQIVRGIMADHAESERALKRGGGASRAPLHATDTRPGIDAPAVDPTPTSNARFDELQQLVRDALGEEAWTVWSMRHEGAEFDEIGETIDRSAAAARGLYHRSRKLVQELLGDEG